MEDLSHRKAGRTFVELHTVELKRCLLMKLPADAAERQFDEGLVRGLGEPR